MSKIQPGMILVDGNDNQYLVLGVATPTAAPKGLSIGAAQDLSRGEEATRNVVVDGTTMHVSVHRGETISEKRVVLAPRFPVDNLTLLALSVRYVGGHGAESLKILG